MNPLPITLLAEQDLIDIWLYTAGKWGPAQADVYLRKIEACFEGISQKTLPLRHLADDVYAIRCERHVIFLLSGKKPIVIAILHEKMDMLVRLNKRLS